MKFVLGKKQKKFIPKMVEAMPYEEANIRLKLLLADIVGDYADKDMPKGVGRAFYALEKAEEAIEKQIPKRPTYEADGYANGELVYDTWYCPNCGKDYEVGYDYYDYCPCCGQRIDRSEVE